MTDLTQEDIEGLPQELLDQLTLSEVQLLDFKILANFGDGWTSIDRLLVNLYLNHEEIIKRTLIVSRLYRMTKRGDVEPQKGKKGVYRRTSTGH